MEKITPEFLEKIRSNERIRRKLAYENPIWFSLSYLNHHFEYPFAPFHLEMYHLIQQTDCDLVAVMAFRESGKSTIMNTVNILWSILGKPGKKLAVIVSKTQEQAKNHFANIKAELENNELLKKDFGPFIEDKDDFKKLSLELIYHGSKIISVDRSQSVRGMKYGQFRPDLIVCDDLEDISSIFDQKESDEFYERFQREIIPLGGLGARIIVLGNLLSENSLIMKIKNEIDKNKIKGIFRIYPLLDDNGKILWPQKFPDFETLKKLLSKLSKNTWDQEYLLNNSGWEGYHKEVELFYDDEIENPCRKLSSEYAWKLQGLYSEYNHELFGEQYQLPLIAPMKEFHIRVLPIENELSKEISQSDPNYARCRQLKIEIEKLEEKARNNFKKCTVDGIRKRAMERSHDVTL